MHIDSDADAGADDFVTPTKPAGPFCTPEARVIKEVGIAANGCSVTASAVTRWCANGEPQCTDYQLTLHVHGQNADVEGSFRRCWCGTSGPDGTTVHVTGSAVRE